MVTRQIPKPVSQYLFPIGKQNGAFIHSNSWGTKKNYDYDDR